jgi:hypothetical protein
MPLSMVTLELTSVGLVVQPQAELLDLIDGEILTLAEL